MQITEETLKQILANCNRHDLDAIMAYFSEDCSFDFPRGPEYYGQRFTGKAQVREALAGRFKGIPDVQTPTTAISYPKTAPRAYRNGPLPAPPPPAFPLNCAAATTGSSWMVKLPQRFLLENSGADLLVWL